MPLNKEIKIQMKPKGIELISINKDGRMNAEIQL